MGYLGKIGSSRFGGAPKISDVLPDVLDLGDLPVVDMDITELGIKETGIKPHPGGPVKLPDPVKVPPPPVSKKD